MRLELQRTNRGIALIIVMLVIVALSILAAGFAFSIKVETKLARNVAYEPDMLWLARSGVELARYVLREERALQPRYSALNQKWAGGPGDTNSPLADIHLDDVVLAPGRFSVHIADFERRMNVNFANPEVLERALELIGLNLLESSTIVNSIEDWRDPDYFRLTDGAETDDYLRAPRPYMAKDGPIDHLSELLLVQGMSPGLLWGSARASFYETGLLSRWTGNLPTGASAGAALGLADLFNTVGEFRINVNTASAQVLQLVPGIDEIMAQSIVDLRAGMDGMDGTEDDLPLENPRELINAVGATPQLVQVLTRFCDVRSQTFEVRVQVEVGNYRRTYVAWLSLLGPNVPVLNAYWE